MFHDAGFWTVSGWVVAVICLLFAIWAWINPRPPRRRLAWTAVGEAVLLSEVDDGVEVLIDGNQASRLSRCTVTFVNAGNEPIAGPELTATDDTAAGQLKLTLPSGVRPLRVRVVDAPDYARAEATAFDNGCLLSWMLLEPRDALDVSILHDGAGETTPTNVQGHVSGGRIKHISERVEREAAIDAVVRASASTLPIPFGWILWPLIRWRRRTPSSGPKA